uniref:Low density lipoprotein receptor class A domain containing 4a n=1 Tax=Cynoglossus semilaevis TaxID=244447 RepID=A0A3P8WTX6_CYNSE
RQTEEGGGRNTADTPQSVCGCRRSMYHTELPLVQIITIVLVMSLITVVIICLLSHYWLPALAFFTRVSHVQRDQATRLVSVNQHLYRLQPVYPYLRQEIINLPPIICLSDGEERLPYKGPCRLKLRDPEQQLELRRATVSAPPNRSVFDIDPTGVDPGSRTDMEDFPPPSYGEAMVIEDFSTSTACFAEHCDHVAPAENKSSECDSLHTVP